MKVKKDFILRKVSDSYIVVPVGEAVVDFSGMVNLNESGACLFEALQKGIVNLGVHIENMRKGAVRKRKNSILRSERKQYASYASRRRGYGTS